MRRLGFKVPGTAPLVRTSRLPNSSSSLPTSAVAVMPQRQVTGITGIVGSLIMMGITITWGGMLFNILANIYFHGRFRFRGTLEGAVDPASDFKGWRYVGGCFGFIVYWFLVGPAKYRHSDMEKWSWRVGPF